MSALQTLSTPRLLLRAAAPQLAAAVSDYYLRNAAHLAPWEPSSAPGFHDEAPWRERLLQSEQAFATGQAYRYLICEASSPERVVGQVHISQVARGPFQNGMVGYSLDAALQGRGLMAEALAACCAEMFSARVWLHRLQAGVRPENQRSIATLRRVGFMPEGFSPRYLFIDGAWRDHQLFALHNPAWGEDEAPR